MEIATAETYLLPGAAQPLYVGHSGRSVHKQSVQSLKSLQSIAVTLQDILQASFATYAQGHKLPRRVSEKRHTQ